MTILRTARSGPATAAVSIAAGMLLASTLAPTTARATEPTPIAWRADYGSALEEARASNRLVWIQFTGPWCPSCLRMERDSFPDAGIIEHTQRSFVPLKLRSDVHERLALAFNLSGLPATVLVTPTREIVAVRQGYLGPEELDELLSQSLASWREREAAAKKTADATRAETPSKAVADAKAKGEPQPALEGYCPVSLIADRRLVPGLAEQTVEHDGHRYRFAGAAQLGQFRKDPERYIPVNRGNCPVAQVEQDAAKPGNPRWGLLYQGRLFVFASDAARRRFLDDPVRYAMVDVAEQGFCPHCLGEAGLLVRGDPKFAVTRDGRRYWFPDDTHRTAYLAAAAAPSTKDASTTSTASRPPAATRR